MNLLEIQGCLAARDSPEGFLFEGKYKPVKTRNLT
jgi:hypothetical protein